GATDTIGGINAIDASGTIGANDTLLDGGEPGSTFDCGEPGSTFDCGEFGATFDCGESGSTFDCGESGSTLRFLIPIAALFSRESLFTGHGRLMERPLTPYLDALQKRGAAIVASGGKLCVRGPITSGAYALPGDISSQYISGLLFALPLLSGDSVIELTTALESASYVELTIDVMRRFGVSVERSSSHGTFSIRGGQRYAPCRFTVESDFSQAAFFLVAGALGRPCECIGLPRGSKQGDRAIVELIRRSGARVSESPDGGLTASPPPSGRLLPQEIDVGDIPDLVPPLAALLSFCEGKSRIYNAGRLRHKESDRLASVAAELSALGARVEQGEDSLTFTGVPSLRGGRVKGCNDHRIAMMLAVAAIRSAAPVFLSGSECVAKSYPGFWADFERTV
ncbi:MAG: 3-phosphoshikimate 1-carboxyvinyltransferase, partial [Clostridiales bacterium]|nr:3-phosphoshikimate 1-carboxyvinyltransferase [Clostridiales bacterium]